MFRSASSARAGLQCIIAMSLFACATPQPATRRGVAGRPSTTAPATTLAAPPGPVAEELCNGLDDNRNGTIDEGCACANGWATEHVDHSTRRGYTPPLHGISAWNDHDIVVVGEHAWVHYDGRQWTEHIIDLPPLESVSMFGPGSFYATAYDRDHARSALVRCEANGCEVIERRSMVLRDVYSASREHPWIVDVQGTLDRMEGQIGVWTRARALDYRHDSAIDGLDDDHILVGGMDSILEFDGTFWTEFPTAPDITWLRMWMDRNAGHFAVGGLNEIYEDGAWAAYFDGRRWQSIDLHMPGLGTGVAGIGEGRAILLVSERMFGDESGGSWGQQAFHVLLFDRYSEQAPRTLAHEVGVSGEALWASNTNNIFVVASDGSIRHRCGAVAP